jgi:CRP-like cAMP-binding protein
VTRSLAEVSSPSNRRPALFPRNTKIEALGRVPLFSGFSKRQLAELAKIADDLEIPAGRKIATEGTRGREFFAIVDGEVELTKNGRPVKTLGPGEFCGEFALIVGGPRLTTATAKTPLRVFVLTERHFKQLVKTNPGVELKVMRSLVEWLLRVVNDPALTG